MKKIVKVVNHLGVYFKNLQKKVHNLLVLHHLLLYDVSNLITDNIISFCCIIYYLLIKYFYYFNL